MDNIKVLKQHNDIRLVQYADNTYAVEYCPYGQDNDWGIMGGCVGYNTSEFRTYGQANDFYKQGLKKQEKNADIWLEMLECRIKTA